MKKQTVILDLDDTLVHCNRYFKESIAAFTKQMQEWFKLLTKEKIQEKQLEIDLKGVEEFGLHSSRYPESLVATYKFFCEELGRVVSDEEIDIVYTIGVSVFEVEVQPLPYMYEVLDELKSDGHELYIFTGGDEENQKRKILHLELKTYFDDRVFIFEHKDTAALKEVLDTIKATKKDTWMIGNSLKTDIKPALELGIHAIHIPSENEWSYNKNVTIKEENREKYVTLESLHELPAYIREHSESE